MDNLGIPQAVVSRQGLSRSTGSSTPIVDLFLGQCRLILLRTERGLPCHSANLRNLARIALQLADLVERAA